MQVHFRDSDPLAFDTPLLAVGVTMGTREPEGFLAGLDRHLGGAVARVLAGGDLRGKAGDQVVLYAGNGGPARVVLLGMGEAAEVDAEAVRRLAGRAVRAAESLHVNGVALQLPELTEGAATAA